MSSNQEPDHTSELIWEYVFDKFPDVSHITTPFWPRYIREEFKLTVGLGQPLPNEWENLLSSQANISFDQLKAALINGEIGDKDPTHQEAQHFLQFTRDTYDHHADDYRSKAVQHSPLDQFLGRFADTIKPSGWILDVGCGPGGDMEKFQRLNKQVIGIDYSLSVLRLAQEVAKFPVIQMDIRNLGFVEQSLDGIWCVAVLLHLLREDIPHVLEEFAKVLRQNGLLFISVKQGSGSRLVSRARLGDSSRLFTFFSKEELTDYLLNAGFTIDELSRYAVYREGIGWDVWINLLVHSSKGSSVS